MTQTQKASRKVISGVGWSNPLTHDYRVDQAADVHVFADTVELTQGVDYSVTGVGLDAGYSVTITSPGSWTPTVWVLDGEPAIDQSANLSIGGQYGVAFENAIDKLTRRVQRVYDLAQRSVKVALTTAVGVSYDLPAPDPGMAIGWNDTGTGLETRLGISAADIAAFEALTVAAGDSATAAAGSASAAGTSATNASNSAASALASYNATVAAIAALGNPVVFKGAWDASAGTFPGAGAAKAGWEYIVTVPGTVNGVVFELDDILIAVANNASATVYAGNWYKLESDLVQSVAGLTGVIGAAALKTALALVKGDVGLGNVDNTSDATKNSATATLTNKRVTPRVSATASSATPTPNADTDDQYEVTALAANATFGAPTGTPTDGQRLVLRIKDNGAARTLAFNAAYRAGSDITLPTTTVLGKTLYLGFIRNAADSVWDLVAKVNNI